MEKATVLRLPWYDIAAWVIAALLLVLVVVTRLLPALLGGLLVYQLVHLFSPRFSRFGGSRAKVVAVALIAVVVVTALSAASLGLLAFFRGEAGNLTNLLQKMADIIESSRGTLPAWVVHSIPSDPESLKATMAEWLRSHAADLQGLGKDAGRALAHILIGMVVGGMISLHEALPIHQYRPLSRALVERAMRLSNAFRRIVFAQVKIAALNTFFTWLYLGVTLPLLGVHLPFTKTLVLVTFLAGLLPVVGNLISNTVIVVVSLSQSLQLAMSSLVFLVVIHKLEYFLNAKIVGSQIRAKAWELLLAMLVMEATFGLMGVVAAPIYYAYLKDELQSRGLV
ncbi:MAG: AI-2E family transporter [Sulfuricellaceae bacterium]